MSQDLKLYWADLHIHTVLSPCTEIAEMTPKAIVQTALGKGLDLIAVCDHNSARNAAATVRAAKGTRLAVIPGLEITSSEEVHILGLFPTLVDAEAVQEEVYGRLFGVNDEEAIGYQVVCDEFDQVDDLDQRLLISATTLSAERVARLIHLFHGLAIAAHVNRSGFGIFSQLGFIPDTLELDALEISRHMNFAEARAKFRQCAGRPLITSSDAHALEDIGVVRTPVMMAELTFEELKKAMMGLEGRQILEPGLTDP